MSGSNGKARLARTSATSPVVLLKSELIDLRRELRETVRAYAARLEIQLAESVAALPTSEPIFSCVARAS